MKLLFCPWSLVSGAVDLEGSMGFSQPPKKLGRYKRTDAKPLGGRWKAFSFFDNKIEWFFLFCVFVLLKCKMIFVYMNLTSISMCLGYKVFLYIMLFLW